MAKAQPWLPSISHGMGLLMLLSLLLFTHNVSAKVLVLDDGQTGDPDYTCSATKPCAIGCCGQNGICGMGPDYCNPENCINSCTAKSECDPANWGPQYAASEKCPLNVCCSRFGFCGTTEEFCGNTQIANPSCPSGKSATRRTIGYYEGWGIGRACDAMLPEQIPVVAYTHINFAFAMIDPVRFAIAPMSEGDADLYARLTALKASYPGLQVWISIGGWSMNDPDQPTATTFSDLAASTANQHKFFASLISFMSHYGFDGVDIDWEYPVAPERSVRPEDYQNYPVFLQNLRNAFQAAGKSWGLTITMPSSFWHLQHFDIVKLEPIVDWFNMMEYDIHGTWDATSVWTGPYVAAHTNLTEIDQSMKLLWRNGINPAKVVLGLGFYGRSYTLADSACNKPGCMFTAGGPAGPCTDSVGTLSYGEIQRLITAGAKPVLDSAAAVQTLTYGGNHWVSYDDQTTLKMKMDYANNNCLGGTMVWAASTDDSKGSAAAALAAARGVRIVGPQGPSLGIAPIPDNPGLCSWTRCGGSCPAGTTAAAYVLDGCPQPATNPFTYRLFCCPSNDVPECKQRVEGFQGQMCVAGSCPAGTQLLTTTQFILAPFQLCPAGGHVNWCCSQSKSLTQTLGQCSWTSCGGTCPAGTTALTQTLTGDGGDSPCLSGRRSLCCPTGGQVSFVPNTCGWYRNAWHNTCTPGCPQGKVQLAVDSAGASCVRGYGSFCCDPPANTAMIGSGDPQMREFARFVHAFMVDGVCDRTNQAPVKQKRKKRQFSSLLNPNSHDVALLLAPLLYDWLWSSSERVYITPFRDIWDAENEQNGNVFPSFGILADAYFHFYPIEGDAIDYIDSVLCDGDDGAAAIDSSAAASAHLCVEINGSQKRGGVPDLVPRDEMGPVDAFNKTHSKRAFTDDFTEGGHRKKGQPESGDAFEMMDNGYLRVEYFKWFRYQGNEIEMEIVFILGPQPDNIAEYLRTNPQQHYLAMHIHFNPNGLIDGNLAINQINIRHAQEIQAETEPPMPGRYDLAHREVFGVEVFRCPNQNTGLNPAVTVEPSNLREELIQSVLRLIRHWGVNGDLFNQNNPDPSTLRRFEAGPRSGELILDRQGSTVPMFNGARFGLRGYGGLTFAPDGSLYDPWTRTVGSIIRAPGPFYLRADGTPVPP